MSGQASRVLPIDTLAMAAFIARPVQLYEVPACDILRGVDRARRDANKSRRERIEAMLDRLDDLRDRMIARLDAMDGDPDLEPYLSATASWAPMPTEDREAECDLEPSLSAGSLPDQRRWIIGGDTDAEAEHDGREMEDHA